MDWRSRTGQEISHGGQEALLSAWSARGCAADNIGHLLDGALLKGEFVSKDQERRVDSVWRAARN